MEFISDIGAFTLTRLYRMGVMGLFLLKSFLYSLSPPIKIRRVIKQIHFIGFQSTLVIILTGSFSGMVLGFQGYYSLSRFGSEAFLGPMVGLSLIKELGPVISALMVTGRAGSAIAAEIGIMRITEQIDALELMGLNAFRYLIVPNLIAALISLPLLTAIFDVCGIAGGYLIGGKLLGVGAGTYFGEMASYVGMTDVLEGLYKSLSFGIIIAWVSCYKGYYTTIFTGFGAEGVSKATTQAVVMASVVILVWDYFMTSALF
ncbi:MAG: ABC transporter permease [Deltaproteobacteria bacterium CG_4_8_14_3_um_filter_51_11]|nr:ABC transporter permease [bacterium]OIP42154.1 MAG: ABC transporter permease [Desulfobacteraceae bacterium CG2_30_51_40]PIP45695.1 MAG: ABC transporter permease [Deltaproteobacteria bacterium CG23_combo_of_CG06-09_8_20_14_all_51_20]PIX20107.1 MAG: ABC transporter permease [Deltaproteobacteria bacterium CG_4_8_14_3_um_filter_51_11]PJB38893.1 MAG: ABC transporter permease [Deltaproteobacteria bacterium CG_4_9_14_3_um_filter_51_14]